MIIGHVSTVAQTCVLLQHTKNIERFTNVVEQFLGMKNVVFLALKPCGSCKRTDVSEACIASIFRVKIFNELGTH
jgi:hypothetical protein